MRHCFQTCKGVGTDMITFLSCVQVKRAAGLSIFWQPPQLCLPKVDAMVVVIINEIIVHPQAGTRRRRPKQKVSCISSNIMFRQATKVVPVIASWHH